MKKNIVYLLMLGFLIPVTSFHVLAQVPDSWTQKSNFGGLSRDGAVGFSIGAKGFIGTGDGISKCKDFWEYDPVSDTWAQKADFGGAARVSAVGFSIGSKGYIGTGDVGTASADFWEYDTATNAWTQKANFAGLPRLAAVGFSIGSKGYIGTGRLTVLDSTNRANDFWEYDPASDAWTQKSNVGGSARAYAAGFSVGNKGYIGIGNAGVILTDFWEYDPATDVWSPKADFGGIASFAGVGFSIGNFGYIGVGDIGITGYTSDFWEYAPASDTWAQKSSYSGSAKFYPAGFGIGNKGYMGTGSNGSAHVKYNDFWEYTPSCIPPAITSEPGNQSVTYGSGASFTVGAANALSYHWQEDAGLGFVPVTDGGIYSNATTATLNISLPTVAMNGYKYRCIVTGGCLPAVQTNGVATLLVAPMPVVVKADAGQDKVFGSVDPVYSYTTAPALLNGDVFTGALSRVAGENVGLFAIMQGTLSAGANYLLAFVSADFNILPKPIVITAVSGQAKVYGTADPALFAYTFSPALIGTDVITGLLSRVPGENSGSYAFTLGTLSAGSNYVLSVGLVPVYAINPKMLTVKAGDKGKCYDGGIYTSGFDATYSGFAFGEDQTVLGGTLTFGGDATTAVNPGSYTIIPSGLTSANYLLTFLNGALVIAQTPQPSINGDNTLCAGSNAVQYTTDPGFSDYVWTISYGGIITGGLNSNQVLVNWGTAGSRSITVNYQNTVGCFSSSPANLDVTVLLVPAPLIFGLDSICSGSTSVVYTTQPNQGNYIWDISSGGSIVSGAGTSSIAVDWIGAGNQTVVVGYENNLGCGSLAPAVYNVEVAPRPGASGPVHGPAAVCAGTDGISYSVTPVSSAISYEWLVPAGASIVSGAGTPTVTIDFGNTATGYGIIKVNAVNDCGPGISSPALHVQVSQFPSTPVVTQLGDTLISSANTGNQWFLDGVAIPGAISRIHKAVYLGTYHVEVTQNGCSSAPSNSILVKPVSICEFLAPASLVVFPNPGNGLFTIQIETARNDVFGLEIYNSLGAILWKQDKVVVDGTFTAKVDLSGAPNGVYQVVLKSKSGSIVRKLVIVN